MGAGGGVAGLFIFVIANAAAMPRTAMIPPTTTPFEPFFGASAAALPPTATLPFAVVIDTTAAPAFAFSLSSSSKMPSDAGFAFSAAAFCSAVAVDLIAFKFTTPESSLPASTGRAGALDEAAGSGVVVDGGTLARLVDTEAGLDDDAGAGLVDAPAWLARAAISFSEPRFRSEDRAGCALLAASLGGIDSVLGAVGSDSWDMFLSPAEALDA